jgi:hypothetical protein
MTYDRLVETVIAKLNSGVAQQLKISGEREKASVAMIVSLALRELGIAVSEHDGGITFPSPTQSAWGPPEQRNVRYRGSARRKR